MRYNNIFFIILLSLNINHKSVESNPEVTLMYMTYFTAATGALLGSIYTSKNIKTQTEHSKRPFIIGLGSLLSGQISGISNFYFNTLLFSVFPLEEPTVFKQFFLSLVIVISSLKLTYKISKWVGKFINET